MNAMIGSNRKKLLIVVVMSVAASSGCRFYFQKTTDQFRSEKKSHSLNNGRNLAENVCAGCHYDEHTKRFSGLPINDLPRIGGKLFSANLTHSAEFGALEKYTDAELFYLVKTGISRSGKFMPYMMRPTIADADLNDLIVYLRSNDAPLRAADTSAGITHINLIGRIGIRSTSSPAAYIKNIQRPDPENAVMYGRYLVGVIGCYHCHSKKIGGLSYTEPEKSKGYLAGGMKMKNYTGDHVYAANITPDKETGIGNYTSAGFSKAVREGVRPDGMMLGAPMPVFSELTRHQSDAIFAYLQQVKPVHHLVGH